MAFCHSSSRPNRHPTSRDLVGKLSSPVEVGEQVCAASPDCQTDGRREVVHSGPQRCLGTCSCSLEYVWVQSRRYGRNTTWQRRPLPTLAEAAAIRDRGCDLQLRHARALHSALSVLCMLRSVCALNLHHLHTARVHCACALCLFNVNGTQAMSSSGSMHGRLHIIYTQRDHGASNGRGQQWHLKVEDAVCRTQQQQQQLLLSAWQHTTTRATNFPTRRLR